MLRFKSYILIYRRGILSPKCHALCIHTISIYFYSKGEYYYFATVITNSSPGISTRHEISIKIIVKQSVSLCQWHCCRQDCYVIQPSKVLYPQSLYWYWGKHPNIPWKPNKIFQNRLWRHLSLLLRHIIFGKVMIE